MKTRKLVLAGAVFLILLLVIACESILHTDLRTNQEDFQDENFIFVGRNKNLKNAKIQMLDTEGNKLAESSLSENCRLIKIPSQNVYLKINLKETDNGL